MWISLLVHVASFSSCMHAQVFLAQCVPFCSSSLANGYFLFLQCATYCEVNMTDIKGVLKVGEKVPNPINPCESYMCDVSS